MDNTLSPRITATNISDKASQLMEVRTQRMQKVLENDEKLRMIH